MKASGWSIVSGRLQPRHEYLESLRASLGAHSALPAARWQALANRAQSRENDILRVWAAVNCGRSEAVR